MSRLSSYRPAIGFSLPLALLMVIGPTLHPLSAAAQAARVRVQTGTPVDLVFDQAVSGETVVTGQQVTLRVANSVVVDGKTVIAAGAAAVCEVAVARKSGMVGAAGSVSVVAKHVTAVDGTIIALSGTKSLEGKSNVTTSVVITVLCCVLGLLMKGEKAEIASGSTFRATVMSMVDVSVE